MKPSERRAQMRDQMAVRAQESYNTKDDSGRFKSVIVKDRLGNVGQWKCSEDEHFLNVIPFIAGPNHPTVKEGDWAYLLDIHVHRAVGVNEDEYLCMARTYGKPCAICEHQGDIRKTQDYDEKYVKSLNPTRRAIYNIECLDSDAEINKKVQLFNVSHFLFEKKVAELAKKPRGGGFVLFSDSDEGKTICFRKKGSGATNTEFSAFQFMDRTESVPDAVLDAALVLDQIIHIPTYDEVKNAFFGQEVDEVSDQERDERIIESQESRRPAARGTTEAAPEPAKVTTEASTAAAEFVCPGNAPDDFGNFDACEKCPDVAECEKEFNEAEQIKAEALKREEEARKAAEVAKPAETAAPALSGLAARRAAAAAAGTAAPVEKAADPAPAASSAAPEEGRRVRRRPGQE